MSVVTLRSVNAQVCSYICGIDVDEVSRKRSFLHRDSINLPESYAILGTVSISFSGSCDPF